MYLTSKEPHQWLALNGYENGIRLNPNKNLAAKWFYSLRASYKIIANLTYLNNILMA
jgi:hypothetical protein